MVGMMGTELQDLLALGFVAVAVIVAVWRRLTRPHTTGACAGCASGCGPGPLGSPPERVTLDLRSDPSKGRAS